MVKRKRDDALQASRPAKGLSKAVPHNNVSPPVDKGKISASKSKIDAALSETQKTNGVTKTTQTAEPVSVQIITGSYEKTLHGFAALLPAQGQSANIVSTTTEESKESDHDIGASASFSDTFLFAAHSSAVRCIAVSQPTESHKRVLATGSTDERINLYNLSTSPPEANAHSKIPTLARTEILENPRNRELGSLLHHARSITKLDFPTRGKLFSAAEDNTIAISRARDWTVLSTIKAPIPKPIGRASGDTAAAGDVPTGINDFAIHPSMKLMVSVSKGEKSMRLWNLVTGKKAGVLNFDRQLLQQVGETRYSSGEGRRVLWTSDGGNYAVGFERGVAVFGIDSKPKAVIKPSPASKIHQMRFLPAGSDETLGNLGSVLAVSTEDGRIIFYELAEISQTATDDEEPASGHDLPLLHPFAQLGGPESGLPGRVKDFEILDISREDESASLLCIAASSDGAVRLWKLRSEYLRERRRDAVTTVNGVESAVNDIGSLVGTHETGARITCLAAFIMDGPKGVTNGVDEADVVTEQLNSNSDSDSE